MYRFLVRAAFLLLVVPSSAFPQSFNASLGGVVQDASRALIPGVTVTAANAQTGVVSTTISNESGAYNIPSLLPGNYKVSAELPGFRPHVFNEVQLGPASQVRLDFALEVGSVAQAVEVTVAADTLLAESSPSIGEVLPEYKIRELPIVGNDVLDLVRIMPGYRQNPFGGEFDTFAGISAGSVNTVRDGLSVSDGRFTLGIFSTTLVNPDLVGEVRLILSPVDAEVGRGNGQVQIQTRSGTNEFRGSAVWNIRNSALNGNTWGNNNDIDPATGGWAPTPPNWYNRHQYTVSFGGPIVKNKTFFFGLWDQQIDNQRTLVQTRVLTDTARQGIFRYFEGWNNGNARATTTSTGTNPTIAVVDFLGNPLRPATNPGGGAYTGSLRCFSVFGPVKADGSPFTSADCPGGTIVSNANPWDSNRRAIDPTGFIRKYMELMPRANAFYWTGGGAQATDGLNTAIHRWWRRRQGSSGYNSQVGLANDGKRKQINLKFDHNFTARHRASVGWTYEWSDAGDNLSQWPDGPNGESKRRPTVLTVNVVSTLAPNLVNEARYGLRKALLEVNPPWDSSNPKARELARTMWLQGDKGFPVVFGPGSGGVSFQGPVGQTQNPVGFMCTSCALNGNYTPLYTYADTLSWTKNKHAFKFGGEIRLSRTKGYNGIPEAPLPNVDGGAGGLPANGIATTTLPSFVTSNQNRARELLYFLTGSVNQANMLYWIDGSDDVANGKWEDYLTQEKKFRIQHENEFAVFFKDDWKVRNSLTLNLGLRYEYYGVPFIATGFTSTSVGHGAGLWGVSKGSGNFFESWMRPAPVYLTYPNLTCVAPTCDPTKMTAIEFVGPKTPNPDKSVYRNDLNNFGPAIGFAWQVPWFGRGRTTVRGGYQVTYGGSGRNGIGTDTALGGAPGATSDAATVLSDFQGQYLDLTDLTALVPVRPTAPVVPGGQIPIYNRAGGFTAYDPNYATPYVQNFTMSVTRNVRRNMTVDLRYVGTYGKKLTGNLNLNQNNVYFNKELFEALEVTRGGGNALLLDQLLAGLNLNPNVPGYGAVGTVVNGVLQTGSAHLRRLGTFTGNIANGNFDSVADTLNTLNTATGLLPLTPGLSGVGGRVLRNGCDRLAAGQRTIGPGNSNSLRCFPENFISANPQFGNTTTYNTNSGSSNYHSMQAQFTLRPTIGMNFQGTYTWSRTLALPNSGYTDPTDRDKDYTLTGQHLSHEFRGNGSFELPIGPGKPLLRSSSGWLARLVERWQGSVIFNVYTGRPVDLTAQSMLYGNGVPDVVGPWPYRGGKIVWEKPGQDANGDNQINGNFFAPGTFIKVADPQCAGVPAADNMGFNLRQSCTIDALADAKTGQILLQNPKPGTRGTLGQMTMQTRGVWSFDASMSKTVRLTESKSLQVRMDATNVLNHPTPNDPTFNINSNTAFGTITDKGFGTRQFQGQVRFNF